MVIVCKNKTMRRKKKKRIKERRKETGFMIGIHLCSKSYTINSENKNTGKILEHGTR